MTSTATNRPAPETVEVTERRIACDGGGSAALHAGGGHPKAFLNIGADGFVDCTYCDRRFVLKAGAGAHH